MKTKFTYMAICSLLFSCASLEKPGPETSSFVGLGVIVKEDGNLMHKRLETVGKPYLERALEVSVSEFPLSKSQFKAYQKQELIRGKKPSFVYSDSLPKPRYLSLQLADKFALQSVLSREENSDVCKYLEKDSEFGMVTTISLMLNEQTKAQFLQADEVFLAQKDSGKLFFLLSTKETVSELTVSDDLIFDYELTGFCWGEDRYGNKQIDALVPYEDRCPPGTERKAHKLNEEKQYLKL